jgi:hypothetical protein
MGGVGTGGPGVCTAPGAGVAASFSCAAFTAPGSGAGTASFSSAMEENLA